MNTGTCPPIFDLQSYLEGLMSPQDSRALENHVSTCPTCQQHLQSFRETFSRLDSVHAGLPGDFPHPKTLDGLMKNLRLPPPASPTPPSSSILGTLSAHPMLQWGLAILLVIQALVILRVVISTPPSSRPSSPQAVSQGLGSIPKGKPGPMGAMPSGVPLSQSAPGSGSLASSGTTSVAFPQVQGSSAISLDQGL